MIEGGRAWTDENIPPCEFLLEVRHPGELKCFKNIILNLQMCSKTFNIFWQISQVSFCISYLIHADKGRVIERVGVKLERGLGSGRVGGSLQQSSLDVCNMRHSYN